MLSALRSRLTYANVMATLAVFVALGGTSYAALAITGKNVKNGSLTGADIKDESLSGHDVRDRSLQARDFRVGSLPPGPRGAIGPKGDRGPQGPPGSDAQFTGAKAGGALTGTYPNPGVDASKLAKVPAAAVADTLGGLDSTQLLHGHGQVLTIDTSALNGGSPELFRIPGELTMNAFCNGKTTNGQYGFTTGNSAVTLLTDNGGGDPTVQKLSANSSIGSSLWATNPAGDMHVFSAQSSDMTLTIAVATWTGTNIFRRDFCQWQGHVVATTG